MEKVVRKVVLDEPQVVKTHFVGEDALLYSLFPLLARSA